MSGFTALKLLHLDHELAKLIEVEPAALVGVELCEHIRGRGRIDGHPQLVERDTQLRHVDVARLLQRGVDVGT